MLSKETKARYPKKIIALAGWLVYVWWSVDCRGQDGLQPAHLITRFPFIQLTGGVTILRATVGDRPDSLNFVLDTGSGGISLDSVTAAYLRLPAEESDRTIRGIAGIRKVKFVRNHTLHLPGVDVHHLDFHINDYDILTSVYGVRIDGIIGYSFLNRYIVKIDYDTQMLEVWEPGSIKYPRGGYVYNASIRAIPVVEAEVKDAVKLDASFYFDTGAGLHLLMSERFVEDKKLFKKKKKIFNTQAEGLGGKKPMLLTTIKRIKVGPFRFRRVPVHVFDDAYNVTAYPILGGLLGNDLFRRFNIILNYQQQEIHIKPNKHYHDAFDYSYTGMSVYFVNGNIVIEDILPESPAAEAGIQAGDRILAVDKNFSNNIQQYKHMLQTAGARLKLLLVRNEQIIEVMLKVKSIR